MGLKDRNSDVIYGFDSLKHLTTNIEDGSSGLQSPVKTLDIRPLTLDLKAACKSPHFEIKSLFLYF